MVRHIIMWNLADSVKDIKWTINELKSRLEALKSEIPEIVEINVNVSPLDTKCNAQILLDSTFNTREDLEKYIEHPAHKEVGKFVRSNVTNRMCMDYEF